jgi:hypothetical protein
MPQTRFIHAAELREMFNRGRYVERAASGELIVWTRGDHHPTPVLASEPYCTVSQMLRYVDRDPETGLASARLAVAHQYLRPDGTIGASGRPDPKSIFADDVVYQLETPEEGQLETPEEEEGVDS